jgi:hypothetical protein
MATSKRFIRCPNCHFEHLKFGTVRLSKDSKVTTPWTCPFCHWHGELLPDRSLTKEPPSPESKRP